MNYSKKSEYLQIRVSKSEKNLIKESANAEGIDMSSWILKRVLNKDSITFTTLLEKFNDEDQSFVFAAINDFLNQLNKTNFESAIANKPNIKLTGLQINYLIAMILQRANQLSMIHPDWISHYPKLANPHFGTGLKSLKLYLLINSPIEFKSRNIFIDSAVGDRV